MRINGWRPSRLNLGVPLSEQGQESEAIANYRRSLRANPGDSGVHNNLANALLASGQIDEAIVHFRQAVQLRPNYFKAQSNFAVALVKAGQLDEAIVQARAALQANPRYLQAHHVLGIALSEQGRPREAVAAYEQASRIMPGWPHAMRGIACLYATYPDDAVRDGAEAVRLAREASGSTGNKNALMLDTLAAAHAEAGSFVEAVSTAEQALAAARAAGNDPLAAEIEPRLELYRAGRPCRDEIAGH